MRKVRFFAAIVLACLPLAYDVVEAKNFTKCGLTKELLNNGFGRTFIGNWVCLIESESAKDTSKVTLKADRTKSLGLFQINDKKWCKWGSAGGMCNIKCETLIDDDISNDSKCARRIQSDLGFRAWNGWMNSCYGRPLPFPPC